MAKGKIDPLGNKPFAVKTCWGMETKLHLLLTSAVDGGKWPISPPARFTPAEKANGIHLSV
jgi:hypothetical protein